MPRPGPDAVPVIHSITLSLWDPAYSVTEHVNPRLHREKRRQHPSP